MDAKRKLACSIWGTLSGSKHLQIVQRRVGEDIFLRSWTSKSHKDKRLSFMAYEGESQTLAARGKMSEAVGKLNRALTAVVRFCDWPDTRSRS
jgi:DNA mismatch repair protein MutH